MFSEICYFVCFVWNREYDLLYLIDYVQYITISYFLVEL